LPFRILYYRIARIFWDFAQFPQNLKRHLIFTAVNFTAVKIKRDTVFDREEQLIHPATRR
jgi:hypothetical protein